MSARAGAFKGGGAEDELIHAVVSHGYGIRVDTAPEHEMEKVLFASDELTGLIGAAARMRPSKSAKDMELSSLKKRSLKIKIRRRMLQRCDYQGGYAAWLGTGPTAGTDNTGNAFLRGQCQ